MSIYKRISLLKRQALCLLAAVIAALMLPLTASASAPLTVDTRCGESAVEGIEWKIYRIGERDAYSNITIGERFAGSGAALGSDDLTEAEVKEAADAIEKYITDNSLAPDATAVSDVNGIAQAQIEGAGIYFIRTDRTEIGEWSYTALPALFEVREGEPAEVMPKMEGVNAGGDDSEPGTESRPGTDSGDESNPGRKTDEDGDSPGSDDSSRKSGGSEEGKTPQTGQLWWPVPVLGAAGLVLVALGLRIRSGKGGKNDQ
ncbi:MAG: hypothetical protein IKP95_07645 [Ruminococcus sp.]|nr:hypothetical protein [Ruminococcus sp.]